MTMLAGIVIQCDERGCIMRRFHVGSNTNQANSDARNAGWDVTVGMHRCADHAQARRARN